MAKRILKSLTDIYLIEDIKFNKDQDSIIELHERYKNMCFKQVHKFQNYFRINGINRDDMLKQSLFLIYDSAVTFDPDRNIKYITWLGNKVKFFCMNYTKKEFKSIHFLEYRGELCSDVSISRVNPRSSANLIDRHPSKEPLINSSEAFNFLIEHPDKRIKEVFEIRYSDLRDKPLTWRDVGKKLNLSSQTAINLHSKGIKYLRKKIKLINQ
jgi:DNA-directed RNA polymerase specialized sigma subunit